MEKSFDSRERRTHPRFMIDLPLEYRDGDGSCLRGGIVVNASEGGFLIETIRDIRVGTELSVTVLFPKGYELTNFKVVAMVVWKRPLQKEDWRGVRYWEGYQYGLECTQISEEDRLKLDLLLGGRYHLQEMLPMNEFHTDEGAEF